MDKEFYDKYSKDLECSCCQDLQYCINWKEPLKINCAIHYFKDKITDLESKLAEKEKEYKFKLKEMDNEYKKEFKTFEEDCKHLYKTETKKAIADRLAEERKKVVQEIKKVLDIKASYSTDADDDWLIQIKENSLYELLDQIERGE